MKKILTAVAMALLLLGCVKQEDDHSAILEKLAELDNRVSALEGSIASIQSAIGDGVFAQKVEPYVDTETGKTIGVTVTYTSGKVVYFEISPKAGYAGPVLGVITNGAGQLVWAVDGVAIKDNKGNEVPVNKTPVFTIDEDGNLLVSIDGGDPVVVGKIQNEGATLVDGIFKDIRVEQDKIVLVLSDDTIVNIPFATAFRLNIEKTEYVLDGKTGTITIPYTVSGKTANTVVGVAGYDPYYFYVEVTEENILITPLHSISETVFLIYADSQVGLTSMVSVSVSQESAFVIDPKPEGIDVDYVVEAEGGELKMHVVSNVDIDVIVKESDTWISIVETKAKTYTITAMVGENNTVEERIGQVGIYKKGTTENPLQRIIILQKGGEPEPAGAVNLSKKGAANSYIVTKAGEYKFWTVKGNSNESVGAVAKAEILWETENTATAPEANSIIATVSYAKNYITFTTPETLKPGNALIAAKDASGKILWSWHIWIPKTAITTNTYGLGEVQMMSRTLGALMDANGTDSSKPDITSVGLMYQWGRKDPFMGAGSFFSSTGAHGAATAPADVFSTSASANVTIAHAIENPTEYAKGSNDEDKWSSEETSANWGDEKTIYDPCPPGYRVPNSSEVSLLNKGKDDIPGWKAVKDYNWFEAGSPATQFANAGFIEETGLGNYRSPERVIIWSSTAYTDNKRARCAVYNSGSISSGSKQAQARGGVVRCVVDNGTPILPPDDTDEGSAVDLSEEATANCYIVNVAGDYKFKAVKGNSTESVGTVAKAEILWETYNNAEDVTANSVIAKVAVEEGYITFSTPATLKPGNALIAAKDAEGKVLWSWHIWIPKTLPTSATYGLSSSIEMLDRNIGALDAAKKDSEDAQNAGLFYQWGRKDPLRAVSSIAEGTLAKTAPAAVWTESSTQLTAANMHETPCVFIKGSEDWISESDATLWSNTKTVNDPCPIGYKVPKREETTLFDYFTPDESWKGWFIDDTKNYFTIGKEETSYTVFPFGHFSRSGSYDLKSDGKSWFWTATQKSESDKTQARTMVLNKSDAKIDCSGQKKANGAYVRCVAEKAIN